MSVVFRALFGVQVAGAGERPRQGAAPPEITGTFASAN